MFSLFAKVIFVVLLHHTNCTIVRRRTCPEPELIKNGQRKGSSFTYPNSVEYVCDEGYILIGDSKLKCMQNGQWSGDVPDCFITLCDAPSDPQHGKAIFKSTEYGSRLTYECDKGYTMRENVVRKCSTNSKWSGKQAICEDIKCDVPSNPENGQAVYDSLDIGSELSYECDNGYTLSSDFVRECTREGQWNGEKAFCQVVTCSIPKDLANGKASYSSLEYGSELHYECNEGYSLSQDFVRECTEEGVWNGEEPSCEIITCEVPSDPANGKALYESLNFGSELAYECNDGFILSEVFIKECNGNGEWEGEEPFCQAIVCETPDDPSNGKALYSSLEISSQLKYECNEGYSLSSDITRVCTSDGEWNGEKPTCDVMCKYPEAPEGGSVFIAGDKAKVGSIANFRCNPGRKLVGPTSAKCTVTGHWTFVPPKCLGESSSTIPTSVTDDDNIDWFITMTTYELTTTSESYDERKPSCHCSYSVSDDNLQAYNNQELVNAGSEIEDGSVLTFHCKEPGFYRLTGRTKIRCSNCQWDSVPFPSCTIPREQNDVIIRVTAHPASKTEPKGVLIVTPGTQLTMACSSINRAEWPVWKYFDDSSNTKALPGDSIHNDTRYGFSSTFFISYAMISDSGIYQCEVPSGKSHSVEIEVREFLCPDIPEIDSLFIAYDDGRKIHSTARFWCTKHGSQRIGPANVTCLPTGQWSGKTPRCKNALCPKVTIPDSVAVKYDGDLEIFSKASFQCLQPDYDISGPTSIFCLPTLKWSALPPSCEDTVSCPEIEADDSLKAMYDNQGKIYSKVYFWCSFPGAQRIGPESAVCLPTGKWSNNPPRCENSLCPEMPREDSVKITYEFGRKIFSKVIFECKIPWLQMHGKSASFCLPGGLWTSEPPLCL